MRLKAVLFACSAAMALGNAPALAEVASPPVPAANAVVRYDPDFFKSFQVSTAFDMVGHLPNFTFSSGDSSIRGFAGAAGNVLIDGQRPASKADLTDTLKSLPAAQIDHIEVITGGTPGVDMMGYRQIANIVRKKTSKANLTYQTFLKFFPSRQMIAGTFNYSRNTDGKSTTIDLQAFDYYDTGSNNGKRYTYTPDQAHDLTPRETVVDQAGGGTTTQARLDHSRPFAGGKLSLNGFYSFNNYNLRAVYDSDLDGFEHSQNKDMLSEIGAQYERALSPDLDFDGNLLHRHERFGVVDLYTDPTNPSQYHSLALSDENIAAVKLTWRKSDALTVKAGAESAVNSRDSQSLYTQSGSAQNLPFDKVGVEERRNEYYTVANWQVQPKLSVEAGVKVETSTISVKQNNRSQSFVYPKPSFQIVWSPDAQDKLSWRSERVVSQLNFDDFASSVSLQTTVIKAGNPAIVPQKTWQHVLTYDHNFWDKGAVSLAFRHEDIEDTVDHLAIVTTTGIFDAVGNIGAGARDLVTLSLNLPLDKLAVPNGTFKIDYTAGRSQVSDPVTHQARRISGQNPDTYQIDFDQALPRIHSRWGIDIYTQNDAYSYNASEFYRYKSAEQMTVWSEYKTAHGLTIRCELTDPFRRRDENTRTTWSGLRDQSPVVQQENSVYYGRPFVIVRLRQEV